MKRLYEVTVHVGAYILAESPEDAEQEGLAALKAEVENSYITALKVPPGAHLKHGWGPATLVYGAERGEVTLAEALKKYTEDA